MSWYAAGDGHVFKVPEYNPVARAGGVWGRRSGLEMIARDWGRGGKIWERIGRMITRGRMSGGAGVFGIGLRFKSLRRG